MAIVPKYLPGQTAPNTGTTPVQSTDVNPNAYGAGLGAAIANAGRDLGETGNVLADHAVKMAALDAKAESDGAAVDLDRQQATAVEEYRSKNLGIAAVNNLPQIYQSLEEQRAQGRANMSSPMARMMYDEATRLNTVKLQNGLASWAADQRKQYNVHQYAAMADNIARGATIQNFDQKMAEAEPQFHAMGTELGWSPEELKQHYEDFKGKTIYGLTVGVAAHDPGMAASLLEKYGSYLDPRERGVLQNQVQGAVDARAVAKVADEAFAHSAVASGDRASRNNNPLNLTNLDTGSWQGQTGTDGRFAVFGTPQAGWAAADRNLQSYGSKGVNTLSTIISRWAPASENNTAAYIQTVAKATGLDPNAHLEIAGNSLAAQALRGKILHAMAQVEGSSTGASNGLDAAEDAAPATLAAIASDPRLHGDPLKINQAQSQYLQNINQARAAHNMATSSSLDRLWTAATQGNISDPAKLMQAYPGALQDWNALGGKAQQNFTRQLTAFGNQATPERIQNFLQVRGGLVNPNTASQYAHMDLSGMDLTRQQYIQLREAQQNVIGRAAKMAQIQANVTSTLQLEPVKQALAARPDLKQDSPEYNQFTGALSEKLEEWIMDHPGKKPGEKDKAAIVTGLLAAKPAHWQVMGIDTSLKTSVNTPVIPPEAAADIRAKVEPTIGRQLSDFEIGRLYMQGLRRGGR